MKLVLTSNYVFDRERYRVTPGSPHGDGGFSLNLQNGESKAQLAVLTIMLLLTNDNMLSYDWYEIIHMCV